MSYKNKKFFITGGTGSLGKALIKRLQSLGAEIIVYSRDEGKQALMFGGTNITRIIGDIRDYDKLNTSLKIYKPDYIIHTAALKRIDDMEFHPDECIKTNINGSDNVARAALENNIEKCILVSTDKACKPVNVYGSSKFIAERLFTNYDYTSPSTIFASIRYGNVIASRGSFIPLFLEWIKEDKTISVTSEDMTRFLFTLSDAVDAVLGALDNAMGGEVFVPQINSYTLPTCIKALEQITGKTSKTTVVGLRPGEKLHEDMLAETELDFTYQVTDINLLQIRPQYTRRTHSDSRFKKYNGPHFNSELWVQDDIDSLVDLIKRGFKRLMKLFETQISSYDTNVHISPIIKSGELGFGPNVTKFEEEFAPYSNKKYNTALNSCSSAGFIIFAYLKEKYGKCDVYTPSIGFTSMTWAAKHHGHNIVFVDVDKSMLMSVESYETNRKWREKRYVEGFITPVVMPILYGGVSTIPNFIEGLKGDEFIVLDSAHCSTPTMKSDVSLFSFHPYKPIAASDGGMLSTDIGEIDEYTRSYRNFGRENTEDGYIIANEGFKCYMNNLNATISLTQLKAYQNNLSVRKEVWDKLNSMGLDGTLAEHDESSSYYVGTLIAKSEDIAKEYREKYCSARLYPPLHQQPYYKECERGPLFDTEKFYRLLVNFPLYNPKAYEND